MHTLHTQPTQPTQHTERALNAFMHAYYTCITYRSCNICTTHITCITCIHYTTFTKFKQQTENTGQTCRTLHSRYSIHSIQYIHYIHHIRYIHCIQYIQYIHYIKYINCIHNINYIQYIHCLHACTTYMQTYRTCEIRMTYSTCIAFITSFFLHCMHYIASCHITSHHITEQNTMQQKEKTHNTKLQYLNYYIRLQYCSTLLYITLQTITKLRDKTTRHNNTQRHTIPHNATQPNTIHYEEQNTLTIALAITTAMTMTMTHDNDTRQWQHNTRPNNTPHAHHTRVHPVHSKVENMPISMAPEFPHAFQGLNGCSTRIKSILPSSFQSTIRGRRKSVRFAVTRSKGLSSTSRNWPSESWRKWFMGLAKSVTKRSNRPSWSQSATLKWPQPRRPLMRRKGFSFTVSLMNINPQRTFESEVVQHSRSTNLCPSQFFLEVQCGSHSTSHPSYLPEAYPICHRRWCQELRAHTQRKIPSHLWKGWALSSQNSLDLLAQTSVGLLGWSVCPPWAWNILKTCFSLMSDFDPCQHASSFEHCIYWDLLSKHIN